MTSDRTSFAILGLLDELISCLAASAAEKSLTLYAECDPALPGSICGDRARLRQVLLNLAGNAVKFTETGSVTLSCRLMEQAGQEVRVRFSVTDTGIGIPRERQSRLFQPFSQLDASAARRHGGTGLGLALSRRIVESLGGEIGCESRPGRGSCFYFTLSLETGQVDRTGFPGGNGKRITVPVSSPPKAERGLSENASSEFAILLAEDNLINQKVARRLLKDMGYRVEVAANGEEAVRMVRESRYDAVLMDCQMPGMDGYSAAAEIRRGENGARRIPIIAMTAHVFTGDRDKCLAAGMDDYLTKPIQPEILRQTIEKWIGNVEERAGAADCGRDRDIFDRTALEERAEYDPALMAELIHLFLSDTPGRLAAMRKSAGQGDACMVEEEAHRLKGASANMALEQIRSAAIALEQAARTNAVPAMLRELDRLDRAFERARACLVRCLEKSHPV